MKTYYLILLLTIGSLSACANHQTHEYAESTTKLSNRLVSALGSDIDQVAFESFLAARMAEQNIPGVSLAITHKGETVYTTTKGVADMASRRPVITNTVFEAASLSKPLFGFMTMMFVEDGLLDLDVPLHTYLPFPDIAQDDNWRRDEPEGRLTLKFNPGTGFNYSGEAYQYLALVLAHLAQTDANGLEEIFQTRIAQPLKMMDTQFLPDTDMLDRRAAPYQNGKVLAPTVNKADIFGAAYGVHTHASDFIKWGTALLNRELLSDDSYEKYFDGQNVKLPADNPNRELGLIDWSLGFSIYELPVGELYIHGGNNPGFSSVIILNRSTNWGITIFTNADQATPFMLQVANYLMR